jgi:hypothetical protein
MVDFDNVLELEPPHGFLVVQGKETAVARIELLEIEKSYLIVSNGEAFGVAQFEQPAQVKTKEFDSEEWREQHRITPRERRQWWPDAENFYVYRLKKWEPFEGVKLFEGGQVIDEPKLTAIQWKMVSAAKELPKQITLAEDVVSVTDKSEFVIDLPVKCKQLDSILSAAYQIDIKEAKMVNEHIPLYSLALVRNPRMRVSKKSPVAAKQEAKAKAEKQEGEDMPFSIVARDDEFCVIKTDTEEVSGRHETREEAEAQLAALRINVEAEEGEAGTDKPKKPKPRKKEVEPNFLNRLKLAAKNILDVITLAEKEEKEIDILNSNYGVAQKEVNGEPWHFAWSTNAFEDREGEIFSTESLENYVSQAESKGEKGFFNLWHINAEDGNFNTDFAKKAWQGVVGRFLVEAGPYLDGKRGQAAKEFFKEYGDGHPEIAPEGWGCSLEYRYLPEERETGIYENIWITRTSTLPKFAAANVWTETRQLARSKNMALSEDQIKAAVEVFKDEEFVKNLIAEGESKTAELEAAGVAHKSETKTEQPEPQKIDMQESAAEVGKQFVANLEPMAETITTMATELKELKEWKDKQDKKQGVKDKTETPRYVLEWKRASEQDETIVTDDDGLKGKKPNEAKAKDGDAWGQIFNK